ncbi:MAG: hypothetical protein PVS2B2_12010 [Candidatus Acidiferrum sp.]
MAGETAGTKQQQGQMHHVKKFTSPNGKHADDSTPRKTRLLFAMRFSLSVNSAAADEKTETRAGGGGGRRGGCDA